MHDRFQSSLGPHRVRCEVVQAVASLPGVVGVAAADGYSSGILPRSVANGRSYVFLERSQCPSPCPVQRFWYYVPEDGGHRLVGEWNVAGGEPRPVWWTEALLNQDLYESWRTGCRVGRREPRHGHGPRRCRNVASPQRTRRSSAQRRWSGSRALRFAELCVMAHVLPTTWTSIALTPGSRIEPR